MKTNSTVERDIVVDKTKKDYEMKFKQFIAELGFMDAAFTAADEVRREKENRPFSISDNDDFVESAGMYICDEHDFDENEMHYFGKITNMERNENYPMFPPKITIETYSGITTWRLPFSLRTTRRIYFIPMNTRVITEDM